MNSKTYTVNAGCKYGPALIWDADCWEIWSNSFYHDCTLKETAAAATSCTLSGTIIASGTSIPAFFTPTVPAGESCKSEMRNCTNGKLSGSYSFTTCKPTASAENCKFHGQIIPKGGLVKAYYSATVPAGKSCKWEKRACSEGKLSGSYEFNECVVEQTTDSCTFDGLSVASGKSITAFYAATVSAGQECKSETRKCISGVLSGSYEFAKCSPAVGGALTAAQERELARKRASQLRTLMIKLKEQNKAAVKYYSIKQGSVSGITGKAGKTSDITSPGNSDPAGISGSSEGTPARRISNPFLGTSPSGGSTHEATGKTYVAPNKKSSGEISDISGTEDTLPGSPGKGAPIDNPWVAYMSDTVRTRMVEEMRKNKALREELRKKIAELPDMIPEEKETRQLLTSVLAEAERLAAEPSLTDDLTPLSPQEAFAMDSEETNRAIRALMAQLEENRFEDSLRLSESLFERVNQTHKRCVKAGCLGWWKKR